MPPTRHLNKNTNDVYEPTVDVGGGLAITFPPPDDGLPRAPLTPRQSLPWQPLTGIQRTFSGSVSLRIRCLPVCTASGHTRDPKACLNAICVDYANNHDNKDGSVWLAAFPRDGSEHCIHRNLSCFLKKCYF